MTPLAVLIGALAPAASAVLASPFSPGEVLSYEVTVLGARAGTAELAVGAATPAGGVSTWPLVAQARSGGAIDALFPLHDHYVSWWDPGARRPVESKLQAAEGSKRYGFAMRFKPVDPPGKQGVLVDYLHWEGRETIQKQLDLPGGTVDFLSAIYWLRTRALQPGEHDVVDVYMGKDAWPLDARVVSRETVPTAAGPIPCVHLVIGARLTGPLGNRRDLDAWFSDDPRHLPVLLDSELFLGHLRAKLVKVQGAR